jgi:hypothetical protein
MMAPEEKLKFKKQYELLMDGQIIQMLADGSEAYVEGAFELLQEEAMRRGLEIEKPEAPQQKAVLPPVPAPAESEIDVNTYVQLVIINNGSDRAFIESLFAGSDILYYLQNLNIRRDIDLPVGLMVESQRVEDAIELLKDFKPSASLLLW